MRLGNSATMVHGGGGGWVLSGAAGPRFGGTKE
jgi:hypothetical protein